MTFQPTSIEIVGYCDTVNNNPASESSRLEGNQCEVNQPTSFGATKKATNDQLTDPWESAVQQLYCDSDKQLSVDAVGLSC